jgi:hypothetical protein
MGQLTRFDLNPLVDSFQLKNYVETGTGLGVSLCYAILNKSLVDFYSIEIDTGLANSEALIKSINEVKTSNQNVTIINSNSLQALRSLLQNSVDDKPTLFFLDAHFPGADFFDTTYADSIDNSSINGLPLLLELAEISISRNGAKNDLIIIDDLFLFDSGEFAFDREHTASANSIRSILRNRDMFLGGSISTVIRLMFGPHRKFRRFYENQGYLMILPE